MGGLVWSGEEWSVWICTCNYQCRSLGFFGLGGGRVFSSLSHKWQSELILVPILSIFIAFRGDSPLLLQVINTQPELEHTPGSPPAPVPSWADCMSVCECVWEFCDSWSPACHHLWGAAEKRNEAFSAKEVCVRVCVSLYSVFIYSVRACVRACMHACRRVCVCGCSCIFLPMWGGGTVYISDN